MLKAASWESQIERIRPWVEAETGMDFSGKRQARLYEALRKVQESGKTPGDFERLRPDARVPFMERLTAALTIGESFFFRNEHHFRALREQVLPEILRENADRREIRIWSAGCAAGEEPYSLAILLDQLLSPDGRGGSWQTPRSAWTVSILGTDINPEFLQRAREACYRAWSFRQTSIQQDPVYFTRQGDRLQLAPQVRKHVRFAYLNLVKDVYPSPLTGTLGLDLILFRNVAIYLKPEVVAAILERFHRALRPGGWLLLGEAEVTAAPRQGFDVRRFDQATLFQKPAGCDTAGDTTVPCPTPALLSVPQGFAPSRPAIDGLPEWVPLPGSPANRERNERSLPAWERMERSVQQHDFAAAETVLDRISDRQERAATRLKYVRALLGGSEIARARRMLAACLAEEPLSVAAQLLAGTFAEEAGDVAAAEQAYRRALYVDRNSAIAHFHLALVQRQRGDAAGSRRSLEIVQRLARGQDAHARVEHGDGTCYGRLRELADTLVDFQAAAAGEVR